MVIIYDKMFCLYMRCYLIILSVLLIVLMDAQCIAHYKFYLNKKATFFFFDDHYFW